jgi:hypothetical protein
MWHLVYNTILSPENVNFELRDPDLVEAQNISNILK